MSAALQGSALIDDLPPGAARWHASRPDILARALTLTGNGPPRLVALGRAVLPLMPKRPLASQDLRSTSLHSGTGLLLLDAAVDCPWVSLDGQQHRNVLVIDIDHPDAMARWLALPAAIRPILVLDPWTGRAHAIAPLISPVCIAPDARGQPKRFASFAGRLLAAALGGTLLPFHSCVKWPWGRLETVIGELVRPGSAPVHPHLYRDTLLAGLCWHTEAGAGPLELRAIVESLDGEWRATAAPPKERYGRVRGKPDERGRNCALFDLVRWWAYERFECDRARILDQAVAVNGRFPVPLPPKEVAAVAKSISKFMATKFRRRGTGASRALRGRDRHLTADLSTRDAQSLAARRTNQHQRGGTVAAIQAAAAKLRASGARLTQGALAGEAEVSVRTVRRYWADIAGGDVPTPVERLAKSGHTVPRLVLPCLRVADGCSGETRPDPALYSLAAEGAASRRRHALVAREVDYFKRRAGALSKSGYRMTRATHVRWPAIVEPTVAAEWSRAESALANARRLAGRRKQRAAGKATKLRLAWMARHRDPAVRGSLWETELSNQRREWDRKFDLCEKRAEFHERRRLRLRLMARAKGRGLNDADLDRLGVGWDAIVRTLAGPVDPEVLQIRRAWAKRARHKLWRSALGNAGH